MNKPFSCVIIDDDRIDLDLITNYVRDVPNLIIKETFDNELKAVKYLSNNVVDIVISDIEMPFLKGIELIEILKTTPLFIFVTSHPGFAVNGFDLDAIDYIIKPVSKIRLQKALKKAFIKLNSLKEREGSIEVEQEIPKNQSFFIKENNNIVKLNTNEVLYVESLSDFSKIHLVNDKFHLVLANLKSVESQLPKNLFQRVHRQFIINMDKIYCLKPNEIELEENMVVPLGRTYKQGLMDIIQNKIICR
jgi:two-component system LytT family response regulator